jgi:glycine/sarcosine N-methyltransferase
MTGSVERFYDDLANVYHLLFESWDSAIARQGKALDRLIRARLSLGDHHARVLDAACGIGTQALGLAMQGYSVAGSDISATAAARADREAKLRGLALETTAADFRDLGEAFTGAFDVVMACDNALPHLLTDDDVLRAVQSMSGKLAPGGLFIASVRDYDALRVQRPQLTSERVFDGEEGRRIVFQIWDWASDGGDTYVVNQFIVRHDAARAGVWETLHFTTTYRALARSTLDAVLRSAGLRDVRWHETEETGFYQPIVTGVCTGEFLVRSL